MQNLNRAVIHTPNNKNLQNLIYTSNLAKEIANNKGKRVKSLTKNRGNCLSRTNNGLIELSIHLLYTDHEYVMLRNFFFSEPLEKQFGELRQWSGKTYFIMVQQILQKVYIYKTKLLLKLDEGAKVLGNLESGHECKIYGVLSNEGICHVFDNC